ncbi:flagellar biosynthesis protein FlgN [Pseudosulfitobacter sp. SM2401]|uniref:flagellar biosynthesis protein FlgN n=1 Tax=Pseudosulfitobacter sp. SM2401 TaxID=3350098 RepID=UPI0036F3CEC9
MDDMIQDTIDSLDDLLDAERAALLTGDIDQIGRLMAQKESLIDTLNDQEAVDRSELEHLNSKVERNQELLHSALDGIRTVARRLATMRRIRKTLETYDAQGRKNSIVLHQEQTVERRA